VLSISGKGLNLSIPDIGDNANSFFIQTNPVWQAAQIAKKDRFSVPIYPGTLTSGIGSKDRAVICDHYPLRPQQPIPYGFDLGKVNFHIYL
jgi:hypothetical protein